MDPRELTRNALATALVAMATLLIRVPVAATQGYINLGDAAIFVAALCLGRRCGALAGGLGSAMADLLGGYAHWAPFTLGIKGLEGFLVGRIGDPGDGGSGGAGGALRFAVATVAGGATMAGGYFAVETILYGWGPASVALPGNGVQALASSLIGVPVALTLRRSGWGGSAP